ncbi:MAG: hypothetical protein KAH18_07105 [Psychromonas sp.]|nr:hypothetical protein [Psychromonas sp.]
MASILYDKFGGKYGNFDDREKLILFSCVCMAQTATKIAYEASLSSFKGYNKDRLETFFGKGWDEEDYDNLSSSLGKINNFFNDSERLITFVDARGQKKNSKGIQLFREVRYDIPSERHQEHCLTDLNLIPIDPLTVCYVHKMPSVYLCGAPYEGANPRIYVNTPMLEANYPMDHKAESVLHELSHVLIDTVDKDAAGRVVYTRETCAMLAIIDPMQARKIADAWSFVIIDFLIRPNKRNDLFGENSTCTIL